MTPRAYISHQIPERVRIRIPSERNRRDYFSRLERELRRVSGVETVQAQPLTASILIRYQGPIQGLADHARRRGLFDLRKKPRGESLANLFHKKVEQWEDEISQGSEGQWDLSSTAALALVGIGIFQALQRQMFPPTWTLLADAAALLARSRKRSEEVKRAAA